MNVTIEVNQKYLYGVVYKKYIYKYVKCIVCVIYNIMNMMVKLEMEKCNMAYVSKI